MSVTLPADRVEQFTVTAAASTASTSPVTVATTFDPGAVQTIRLRIPPGHRGLTGLYFSSGSQRMLPRTDGTWLVGDDETFVFDLTDFLDNGEWSCVVYNTDLISHSWLVTYMINTAAIYPAPAPPAPVATPILV